MFEDTTYDDDPEMTADDHAVRHADVVGTDAEGFEHRFSRPRNEVYLVTGDRVEIRQTLGRSRKNDISAWVEFVRQKVGWDSLNYSDAERAGEWVSEQLATAEGE